MHKCVTLVVQTSRHTDLPQHFQPVLCRNISQDTHSQARPWEWVPLDELLRNAQQPPDLPHLIFEQFPSWRPKQHLLDRMESCACAS